MTVAPAVHQCSFFITLALEASVYLRPERAGLTGDELVAVGMASRYKRTTMAEALEWAVGSGQVAWRGELVTFAPAFEPKFTNFMFGTFRPEYRSFAALDAIVGHLKERAISGRGPAGATREELAKVGATAGVQAHEIAVAFEVLRLGRTLQEREGRWIVTPERESLPLPSVVAQWGRLLDQPRPEIERVYIGVRRVIGTGNLTDTLRSDQDGLESSRRVLLVYDDPVTAGLVEQQMRRLGVEPVRAHVDDVGADEKARTGIGAAVLLVLPDDAGRRGPERDARPGALFQWGFLVGRFGRTNVCALVSPGVAVPSSLHDQRQIELDGDGRWAAQLAAELGPMSSR